MSLSNQFENALGEAILRGGTVTGPATVYVGLFTADPTDAGLQTSEVSGNGYARQSVAFAVPTVDGQFVSSGDVTFPVATGAWGGGSPITHIALLTAATNGDVIMSGELVDANGDPDPKVISTNDQLKIAAGSLTALFS